MIMSGVFQEAGTVSIKGHDGNYADLSGINFEGKGGIGLDAYCLVLLTDCNFTGWDTAAVAQNGAWVNAMECTFANNTVGLKFNTSMAYGTAPNYVNNTFTDNAGSVFSGNDADIENKADHAVDTAKATFE